MCTIGSIRENVIFEIDDDVNFLDYDRLIIIHPLAGCSGGGWGTGSINEINTSEGIVPITITLLNSINGINNGVAIHELGHNFGNGHAKDLECGEEVRRDYCETITYGDQKFLI